jgi:acyl-CoA synthetase (AMP-forming)/AMP-acid ligase II
MRNQLLDEILAKCRNTPNAAILELVNGKKISGKELLDGILRVSENLGRHGVAAGTTSIVLVADPIRFIECFLGILHAG